MVFPVHLSKCVWRLVSARRALTHTPINLLSQLQQMGARPGRLGNDRAVSDVCPFERLETKPCHRSPGGFGATRDAVITARRGGRPHSCRRGSKHQSALETTVNSFVRIEELSKRTFLVRPNSLLSNGHRRLGIGTGASARKSAG